MNLNKARVNSLHPIGLINWRWQAFLNYLITSLDPLNPQPYSVPDSFLSREGIFGSKLKPQKALINTWACKTDKLRQVRVACLEAGLTSVFNLVISPYSSYDLPFFGVDLVTLPSGHLLALDFQPVLKFDPDHTKVIWDELVPLRNHWQSKLPSGGNIPDEAKDFFSPGFIWTRLPIDEHSDELIDNAILQAFREYLNFYIKLINKAEKVSINRSMKLMEGQKKYMDYRANKDPARGMLARFFGSDWTESYIHGVLFDL